MQCLVDFFRDKGLAALKEEDRQETWYQDWIDFQARHKLYARVLSPRRYSSLGHHFSLKKLTRFLEVFAYFSPAHAYSAHVSFLGLFPILMSSNEALKKEAVAKLESGELFAFGVSERAHGSDLFANEFTVTPAASDSLRADGSKYYIGNANAAAIVSVLAKKGDPDAGRASKRAPFVFFAVRPKETRAYQDVRKIRTLGVRAAFVGEFDVRGHVCRESDVIARGRDAWDAFFGTINLGKFFLGFGSIGICAHALAEAAAHLHQRTLFGKPVTEMSHIRAGIAAAFARLTAMKLYACRALDYFQVASADERRHLLWSAVQKARVSTEGVKVMALLSECIGARGFESETYFETALRDVQLIPGLEGSTHINFGLTAQFIDGYFSGSGTDAPFPESLLNVADPGENPNWFEACDRNATTVRFAGYLNAYEPLRFVPNVCSFMKQVKAFHVFAVGGIATLNPSGDHGIFIEMGKCFANVAYAQLVAENCLAAKIAPATVALIFHGLIEDFSAAALRLAAAFPLGSAPRALLKRVVRVPKTTVADIQFVYELLATRYFSERLP